MDRLTYIFVWLSRIFHCRGFGVQSPTDYRFVRYVVNEHWPYYKYDEIGQGDDWLTRKVGQLCFRLANWRQPHVAIACDYKEYVQAGCEKCRIAEDAETVELAVVRTAQDVERLLPRCIDGSLLMLDGLHDNSTLWQQLVNDSRATVTFDLYYCGIVLFDSKRAKQHYIINF